MYRYIKSAFAARLPVGLFVPSVVDVGNFYAHG